MLTLSLLPAATVQAEEPPVIHLWKHGAPGFAARRDEPEVVKGTSVTNLHHPSITVFPAPKEKAHGAAVLIVPAAAIASLTSAEKA